MQNGVSPMIRASTSPFASTSGEHFASGEQRGERPPENGVAGVIPVDGVDQDVQTALLPGQKYKGPPNLDPATVSLGATDDFAGQKLSYSSFCFSLFWSLPFDGEIDHANRACMFERSLKKIEELSH